MEAVVPDMRNVKEIHIIPYSHHDYAWTNTREWHVRRYLQLFLEMLDTLKEHDEFTWMIDNVIHSLIPFMKHCPDKIEEMKKRVKEGRIYVANGGYSLVRSTYVGEETFIRNMVEGKRFFQKLFDFDDIEFFYNADVGCGHSQLPQILGLAGHKYYRFQRPEEAMDCKRVPRQFIWEGLDGSRITVSRGTYGGFMNGNFTNMDFSAEWDEAKRQFFMQELRDKIDDLLMADIVWLNYGCDDYRPLHNLHDEPINIIGFVEEWNKREEVKLSFSNPKTYFEQLQKAELPVYEGVLDPCELSFNAPIRGSHSMWRMRGELDRLIVKAESMAAFASLVGTEYPYRQLETLWNQLFEITGHGIEWVYRDDFDDLYSIASGANSAARSLIHQLSEALAGKLQIVEGTQYVFFNVLNWHRKEVVKLHVSSPFGVAGFDLFDSRGRKLDYQVINICSGDKRYANCEYNEVDIVVDLDVPAMGYVGLTAVRNGTLLAEKAAAEFIDVVDRPFAPDKVILNNGTIEVELEKGSITGIKDLSSGRTIDAGNSGNLKFVQTEISPYWVSYWEQLGVFGVVPEKWELVENGPLRWVYRVSGSVGNSKFKQDIVLRKGERSIGFDLELDCARDEGYFAVEFPADPGTCLFADIPFGVEERDLSKEPYGSLPDSPINYNGLERGKDGMFFAKSWASFQSGEMPAAIVSENCSIFYHYDAANHVVSLVLNRSMPLENKRERWFNQTHPNIDGSGVHRYQYHLYLPEEINRFADIGKFAKGKALPLHSAAKFNYSNGDGLQLDKSFVDIDGDNVIVTAFYKEDGKYVLRFYEAEGTSTQVGVTTHFPFNRVAVTDLLGNEPGQSSMTCEADSRRITVNVKPWQIVTLRFECDASMWIQRKG